MTTPNRPAIKIVHPFYNSPRLLAQDGAFTFHSNPHQAVEDHESRKFAARNLDIQALYRWRINAEDKPHIIRQLSGLGITHRAVYPDLDGIAKSLWETEVLWKGKVATPTGRPHNPGANTGKL